ncbi:caspase-14 [Alligator mississippiensis]|uniref:Caspase-14 n=1 Tax=Alligator mississippiensis TaxID=8496 RepID=A0A151P2J1_ALLMI|nr:caspase-14 [Alligator mississippiensis]KYO43298.1 caspase-14 [Alligator mississippiensis]
MAEALRLLRALDELGEAQLKACGWHLRLTGRVSQAQLEEAGSREELAQLLLQLFPAAGQAAAVLSEALERSGRRDLAAVLQRGQEQGPGPVAVPTNEKWQAAQQTHNEIKSSPDELEEYDMRNGRMAFLMCVTTGRTGAENDIEVMRKLFQDYNFTHQECIDPFGQDIVPKLEKFRDEINQSAEVISCCLITLMSHGTRNGYISGKDEVKVNLKDIFPLFNNANCPKLQGKPKIFIIQACRGGNVDEGVEEKDNVFQESDDMMDAMRLPTTSDYFIVYSTQKGYISLRNKIIGSRMIEAMNKVFSQYGMKWHLGDLFTKVNNLLVQRDFSIDRHIVKVTIVMESTLTKAVYLTPRLANM